MLAKAICYFLCFRFFQLGVKMLTTSMHADNTVAKSFGSILAVLIIATAVVATFGVVAGGSII